MGRRKRRNTVIEQFRVEDFAAEGKSLGRWEGKVVFVERTVPGDLVDVFLYKNKKDWAEGYPLRFHEYSPRRATPFCEHYGDCGGCQWQSVPYEEQLAFKFRQVKDALERIGKVPLPEFRPILGAENDRLYRNKLEYTFGVHRYVPEGQYVKPVRKRNPVTSNEEETTESEDSVQVTLQGDLGGGGAAGFHARGLFDKVVDINWCHLQPEPSNKVRELLRDYVLEKGWTFYDVRHHHGYLRNVQLRVCTTGEVMVNVIVGEDDPEKTLPLMAHLLAELPEITTLLYTVNTKKNDSLYDLQPVVYHGPGFVKEKLSTGPGGHDFYFKISPTSFFQTNTRQAERLYQVTREFAELTGKETVYDLYCGTGSIGIFVSHDAAHVVGVEVIAAAIEDAKENAALNGLKSADFFAGDVIDICNDDFFTHHGRPDVIITDPPRAGMHPKLVEKLLEIEAPLIVYVSCNPATQGRDLQRLGEKYEVTAVQPVDMFPHTHHMENVVQLKLKKPENSPEP
jgi:23S rRNA (uracil1939-C5)-methyltransferase